MKIWRNSEGREFPVWRYDGLPNGSEVAGVRKTNEQMRADGYELVDDSEVPAGKSLLTELAKDSVSAEQAGSPSGGTSLAEVIRKAKREAWEEGTWAVKRDGNVHPNPYDPEPPKVESEEFEATCRLGPDVEYAIIDDERLIPGKTYVAREVKR